MREDKKENIPGEALYTNATTVDYRYKPESAAVEGEWQECGKPKWSQVR